MTTLHPCLRCARHIRVLSERCPFCAHVAYARPCAALALCAALAFSACSRDSVVTASPAATPVAFGAEAAVTALAADTDAAASALSADATPIADAALPVTDAARAAAPASDARARRAPAPRATVLRPEREDVPLYGVSPKSW